MTSVRSLTHGLILAACFICNASAQDQPSPVGNWHTFDDDTGELKAVVTISETNGVLSGRIAKILRKATAPDVLCTECTDHRKDQPVLGLEVIRGAKRAEGTNAWEGGKILDPENGKEYTLRLMPIDEGRKLQVRGYIAFFFRTQTWVRTP